MENEHLFSLQGFMPLFANRLVRLVVVLTEMVTTKLSLSLAFHEPKPVAQKS